MSHTPPNAADRTHWRSLDDLAGNPALAPLSDRESPEGARGHDQQDAGFSRRGFLGGAVVTVSAASAALSGCIRKPDEKILPYGKRPEDLVPGRPLLFATSAFVGGQVLGLLVESQDGRPTKVEGNPDHPVSRGTTDVFAQSLALSIYGEERSRAPAQGGKAATWADWDTFAGRHFGDLKASGGSGLAVLSEHLPSPTFQRLLGELRAAFPQAKVYLHDAAHDSNAARGAALAGLKGRAAVPSLAAATVIVALDADFLGTEGERTRLAREYAAGRRLDGGRTEMNRLYVAEPGFSITGAQADHRLRLPGHRIAGFLAALATRVFAAGAERPAGVDAVLAGLGDGAGFDPKWLDAVARDLVAHKGAALVLAGDRQPAEVHALALLVNVALGALGRTVTVHDRSEPEGAGSLADLAGSLGRGEVKTLLMVGGNPVYDAPADLGFADLVGKAGTSIHLSAASDETSAEATWHLPRSHAFEAWGDWRSQAGAVSLQQPLIAPLFGTRSEAELLAGLLGVPDPAGYGLVRATWGVGATADERQWETWVESGVVGVPVPLPTVLPSDAAAPPAPPAHAALDWSGLAAAWQAPAAAEGIEVDFVLDYTVYDGRFANSPWLQELPDPMTKLTWDNAALVSPATAKKLGVSSSAGIQLGSDADLVKVAVDGREVQIPVFVTPGVAEDVVVLPLGYGRTRGGAIATGAGVDVTPLRSSKAPWFATGAQITKVRGSYKLASTQDHGRMEPREGWEPRPLVREATLAEYREDPKFPAKREVMEPSKIKSLWEHPNPKDGLQWAMVIDLNACIGCNACTIACQAENNILVVGKERVLNGREMHWIRLDRYYTGSQDDPQAVVQPIGCQHCETAPCEGVCPVAATTHSPEGLNDMAYNRCIGTRYCSNNCPLKVRRFNFFNFTRETDEARPLERMQRNPDVTVRFRGVMEKCTYCVQRINQAKIEAHVAGESQVKDGAVVTACQQACPTQAITFGDINDQESRVAKLRAEPRNYRLFDELNLHARTSFLARVRNPNPELV